MIATPSTGQHRSTTRADRRSVARTALTRHALATTAVVSIGATALAFVALSARTPTRASSVALPSGPAAAAAFTRGLAAARTAPARVNTASTGATAVAIRNYAFAPAVLSIVAGTKVTWTNDDVAPHTVTVSSGPVTFSSPTLNKGDSFTYTFTTAGTYSYYCAVHPEMTAKVVVTAAPAPAPKPTPTGTTSAPAPTPSTSSPPMPMPMPAGSDCAVSSALQTFLTHVNSAHLDEAPAQQVSDILNIDTYVGNHLALVERMLSPLTAGGLTDATSGALQTFLTHLNSAHLDESPAQQVNDILDVNSYLGNHMALIQRMAAGYEALVC
jgi:plastocyanin